MEEDYLLAKKTVTNIYGRESILFPFFTVAVYALLRKVSDYKELVLRFVEACDIYIDDMTIGEIIESNKLLDGYEFDKFDVDTTPAISIPGITISLNNDAFQIKYDNPIIICSKNCEDITILLNCFIHEMLHLIKSYFNCFEANHENGKAIGSMRAGISIYRYLHYDGCDDIHSTDYFKILDEAINVVQTTEAMEEILTLKDICPDEDKDIREFIDSLDEYKIHRDCGYFSVIPIFRTLWNNKQFKELVERNIVSGEIKEIVNEFNDDMGNEMFQKMAHLIDEIYYTEQENKELKLRRLKSELRKIIKAYNIKNNVLQKISRQK